MVSETSVDRWPDDYYVLAGHELRLLEKALQNFVLLTDPCDMLFDGALSEFVYDDVALKLFFPLPLALLPSEMGRKQRITIASLSLRNRSVPL